MPGGGRRKSLLNFFNRSLTSLNDDEASSTSGRSAASREAATGTSRDSALINTGADGVEVMVVYENERFRDQIGWSGKNLELDDPKNFSWASGQSDKFSSPPPPEGYEFLGIWELDKSVGNAEGWLFARSFILLDENTEMFAEEISGTHRARRRRWTRDMKRRDDVPLPIEIDQGANSSEDETQNTGLGEDRVAEKYLMLKFGSGVGMSNSSVNTSKGGAADEEETRSSLTGGVEGGTLQSLRWLGKQIRDLEVECEREAETAVREWKRTQQPMYKATVREIEKAISGLEQQIKRESNTSEEKVISLEETLKAHIDALNATKKRLYFPNSNVSAGSADAFFAIDDFWVENVSGIFVVDMIGSLVAPQVMVTLTGVDDGPNSGINIKLKLEGFKLRAKGAPNISVQEAVLTACVKVSIMLTFVASTNKWQLLPADFSLDLLAFSGPYGLSRAFVATILAMVGGKIREAILVALPVEIGHLLMTLPIPFAVRGEFAISGTPLQHLCSPLVEANDLCRSLGFNPGHMRVFMDLQKLMGRGRKAGPVLNTMQDMINYRTMGANNSKLWDRIMKLWSQASSLFVEMRVEEVAAAAFAAPMQSKAETKGSSSSPFSGYDSSAVTILATFAFDDIIQAVEDVMRKPLSIEFKLHHISGQVSVNQIVDKLRKLAHRLALISANAGKTRKKDASDDIFMDKRVSALLKRATREFDEAKKVLGILAQNFDYGQVLANVFMKSGAAGDISVRASQILGRAPISIWLNLPQRLAFLGIHCPVPYILALKTDPEGNMVVEFNHCGSEKSTRRGVYLRHEDGKDKSQNKVRVKARRKSVNWRAQWANKLSKLKVQELDEESKFHLSPLISIKDSYKLPAELETLQGTPKVAMSEDAYSTTEGGKIRGKFSASLSKLSSKVKQAVPGKYKKAEAHGDDISVPPMTKGISNEFPSALSDMLRMSFTEAPVTADDFDELCEEEDIEEDDQVAGEDENNSDVSRTRALTEGLQINIADIDNNTDKHSESYVPPKPRTHIPVLRSYRRKARLEQTLGAVPKENDIVEVASAIVYKPKVTIVTEKAMSLKAGAELLTFSLGKTSAAGVEDSEVRIEQVVLPTFRKRDTSTTAPTMSSSAEPINRSRDCSDDKSERLSLSAYSIDKASDSDQVKISAFHAAEEQSASDDFKNSGVDVPEYRRNVIGEADGSPVVVQTGTGIKVLMEVPRVDIRVGIADMLRFINRFMGSPELKAWLGACDEGEEGNFEELIAFVKAFVARAGKYFLLPGLLCKLCIVGKLVVVRGEVVVKLETPSSTTIGITNPYAENTGDAPSSVQESKFLLEEVQLLDTKIYFCTQAVAI